MGDSQSNGVQLTSRILSAESPRVKAEIGYRGLRYLQTLTRTNVMSGLAAFRAERLSLSGTTFSYEAPPP
jgi:hypothetical protein